MRIVKSPWTYRKAKRELVESESEPRTWHYPAICLSREASKVLAKNKFPLRVHMVLRTDTKEYFLVREGELLGYEKRRGRRHLICFTLRFGKNLFVDPERYKRIVQRTRFSWFRRGKGRQLIHLADREYEKDLEDMPKAEGKVAKFLFYNEIEKRLRR